MISVGGLSDVVRAMEDGTYNFCKNGKCIGCGSCCTNALPMTKQEVDKIKAYIKKNGIREQKHMIPTNVPIIVDMTCPFMKNYGRERCVIYEVRPRICKEFICDPEQRKVPDKNFTSRTKVYDVRETFFGEQK